MALRDSAMSALVADGLSHFSNGSSSSLRRNGTRSPLIACQVERGEGESMISHTQGFIQDFELGGGGKQDGSRMMVVCVPTRGV